ncbi:MAG: DEAD/DEAH box helicase [Planctomycetota bacterium]|nr:MAG: DEAD/DEAH box helicase [Planctomycetota bacterium]
MHRRRERMSDKAKKYPRVPFGPKEALRLHQLRLLEWMATGGRKRFCVDDPESDDRTSIPAEWSLTKGVSLYQWQQDCVAKWFANQGRGTVKVVTGGGKTLLALAIAERLQNTLEPELRVAIVVPTIVLMHQWYDAILEHGNLPPYAVGRLGGGYEEDFQNDRRILIAVLASASRQLSRVVAKANVGDRLLMVVDECHHTGAKVMSQVFRTERKWSLGLSATPEREDDVDASYDESLLGREIGPIIYEFNLVDALRQGLVPKFTINHYGLPMTPGEKAKYKKLSRSINEASSALRENRDSRSKGDFFAWARNVASRNRGELGKLARRYVAEVSKRRELLNRLKARQKAVTNLIRSELSLNHDARIILFHESIDEVMRLYLLLLKQGFPVVAEHSELPGTLRELGLDLFRRGIAQIIVSARSLIEGFNVPAVDVGIIAASSGSVRQRIQSLGRVLRRHRGPDGEEKTSCIHVLYAADTVEEHIYGKLDWDATTGVDSNRYFLWDGQATPVLQEGPPRTPLPDETQINPATLTPGCVYPGRFEGIELRCDSQKNVQNDRNQFAEDSAALADAVIQVKGSPGKFKITPHRHFVLVRVPKNKTEWETRFVTQLAAMPSFVPAGTRVAPEVDPNVWHETAAPGTPYPFVGIPVVENNLRYKKKRGGVLVKKISGGGEVYAKNSERAEDKAKGKDAEKLIEAIHTVMKSGTNVTKIEINELGHALYREGGQLHFLCAIKKGLEFPGD